MQFQNPDWTPGTESLRRPLGGRLRTYRPVDQDKGNRAERLDTIRKALLRGELAVNGFNRWRLLRDRTAAIHWTFTSAGETEATVASERAIAEREAGKLSVAIADESSAEDMVVRIDAGLERADLLFAQRDWNRFPGACPPFLRMIHLARQRGMIVHAIAAFGPQAVADDDVFLEARRRWRLQQEPLFGPAPRTSNIERRFGERLRTSGLDPIPQKPVANYYLDFAVLGDPNGLPIRLDIEVDGRFWHEDLPGRQRLRDEKRDRALRALGWRPVRLWADDIERDPDACLERIHREARSPTPLVGLDRDREGEE